MSEVEGILARARACDYAFQPIISTSTFRTHGVEALARLPGALDGAPILDLLDHAAKVGVVLDVERILVEKALRKFSQSAQSRSIQLFCNVDNRVFGALLPSFQRLERLIRGAGLTLGQICWEISERDPFPFDGDVAEFVSHVARSDMRIALDDFGVGISSLERLLHIEPQYVKIDRCFIDGLAQSPRKQAIVAKLCGLAQTLGYSTVAEGVETEEDFRAVREVGCDFAQGYLIERPSLSWDKIREDYGAMATSSARPQIAARVSELMRYAMPVEADALLVDVAERFNAEPDLVLLPVVDRNGLVLGAIYERDLRQLLLSDFGRDLLLNRGAQPRVKSRTKQCPTADIQASVDAIINRYVASEVATGLVLIDDGRYAGYLSNNAVLRLASERDIRQARDQNPLTQLPGNHAIERTMSDMLAGSEPVSFAVIDFDNFKPFNDNYGFAAGDRSLQMFGDALRKLQRQSGAFVGHIGGDDFFLGLPFEEQAATALVRELCTKFSADAASLYSAGDRSAQGISSEDRFGASRFFPLLRASAGVLHLPADRADIPREAIERRLTELKTAAKSAPEGIATGTIASPSRCTFAGLRAAS